MDNLVPVEHNGKRVLTTQQLADFYETEEKNIRDNFDNNKVRYKPGVHFHKLENGQLKDFKNDYEKFGVVGSRVNSLYLWTERGCLLHAKSLGTERAWEVYEMLVETYFKAKEPSFKLSLPQDYPSALRALADQYEENQKLLPKAESFDSLMNADGYLSIEQAAKVLNFKDIGRNNLFKILESEKITFKRAEIHRVYQQYIDSGYFVEKVKPITISNRTEPYVQIFVTPKGLDWLDKYLQKKGYKKTGILQEAK